MSHNALSLTRHSRPYVSGRKVSSVQASEIFLCAFCILTYLKIHLTIPGFGIPYFFSHVIAIFYIIRTNRVRFLIPYCAACALLLATQFLLTSSHAPVPSIKDAQYGVYWLLNFISFFGAIFMLIDSRKEFIRRAAIGLAAAMIAIGIIEVYAGLKPIFDQIRSLYTSSTSIYSAEARDIAVYGSIRPSVFTSEPSSVGNFFGLCLLTYIALSKLSVRTMLISISVFLVGLWVFRTPTISIYIIVGFIAMMIVSNRSPLKQIGTAASVALFAFALFVPYTLHATRGSIDNDALRAFVSSGSYYTRQVAPVESTLKVMSEAPLWGFGFGYGEAVRDINVRILMSVNPEFYDYSRVYGMLDVQFLTNALFEMFVTNGILGLIFILAIFYSALRRLGGVNLLGSFCLGCAILAGHSGLILTFTVLPVIVIAYIVSLSGSQRETVLQGRTAATARRVGP